MRNFLLTLALAAPLALVGCADSAEQDAIDEGAPMGDMEDTIGDGEIIDEPGELEDTMDGGIMTGDSAAVTDSADIIVTDEEAVPDAETIGQ